MILYRIIITPLYMCATQTTLYRLKQPKNFYSVCFAHVHLKLESVDALTTTYVVTTDFCIQVYL